MVYGFKPSCPLSYSDCVKKSGFNFTKFPENGLPNVNACRKIPQVTHYIYLSNRDIWFIFNTFYIIFILFSTECYLSNKFISSCSNNIFFINHMLQVTYPLSQLNSKRYVCQNLHMELHKIKLADMKIMCSIDDITMVYVYSKNI
jgi:hypothetical protein